LFKAVVACMLQDYVTSVQEGSELDANSHLQDVALKAGGLRVEDMVCFINHKGSFQNCAIIIIIISP